MVAWRFASASSMMAWASSSGLMPPPRWRLRALQSITLWSFFFCFSLLAASSATSSAGSPAAPAPKGGSGASAAAVGASPARAASAASAATWSLAC
eukprot:250328-Pyramimonas_sp.AAC.1